LRSAAISDGVPSTLTSAPSEVTIRALANGLARYYEFPHSNNNSGKTSRVHRRDTSRWNACAEELSEPVLTVLGCDEAAAHAGKIHRSLIAAVRAHDKQRLAITWAMSCRSGVFFTTSPSSWFKSLPWKAPTECRRRSEGGPATVGGWTGDGRKLDRRRSEGGPATVGS
jgi:hypothetical protein